MSPRPTLTVVDCATLPNHETVGERIRWLQAETERLAADHLRGLLESIAWTASLAREIADGGPSYHPGAQERARRIADELESQRQTLEQIVGRGI